MLSTADPLPRTLSGAERFESVFVNRYRELFGLVYRLTGDAAATEDILQEAFLKLIDASVLSRPDEEITAWLWRVCLNLASNRMRSDRRARERLERVGRLEQASTGSDQGTPAGLVLRDEARQAVREALAALPEKQRNCLVLRHSGYSYAEIAAALDISVNSVGTTLARAERAFRDVYGEDRDDLP